MTDPKRKIEDLHTLMETLLAAGYDVKGVQTGERVMALAIYTPPPEVEIPHVMCRMTICQCGCGICVASRAARRGTQ